MAYTVIPAETEAHLDALARIWKKNSYDPAVNPYARERFDWLYRAPGGSAQTWLAIETASQAVVGCGSVFRSDRCFNGRRVAAGVPAVFFVEKEHRVAAAALAIQRAVVAGGCRAGFDVSVAKPNRRARPICDRVGYQPVAELQDWYYVVAADGVRPDLPDPAQYAGEIVSAADERFDRLWQRAHHQYPMAAEKTAAFLNWRYSGFQENYRFYCLVDHADRRLLGYVVFYAMKDGVVVSELLAEEPGGAVLENLLLGFCAQMKQEGQVWVSLWYAGVQAFEHELARIGFTRGSHQRTLLVYLNPEADAAFRRQMLDRASWFIFAGEMDVILSDEVWRPEQGTDVVAGGVVAST
jgi:hypothetical protein